MRFGAHLPVAAFGGERSAPSALLAYADAAAFPNAVATTYLHLTDDPAEASSVLQMLVSPHQAPSDLRDRSLVGSSDGCMQKLRSLEAAGVHEVFVWPVRDEVRQLQRFANEVVPHFRGRLL